MTGIKNMLEVPAGGSFLIAGNAGRRLLKRDSPNYNYEEGYY